MKIKNLENISVDQINFELKNGGRFVVFPFCISIGLCLLKEPAPFTL